MNTDTQTQTQTPTIAAVVTHEVEDFDAWKAAFDKHGAARRSGGIVASHINRHADDPNRVSVYLAAKDPQSLETFIGSKELMSAMREAGVKGPPHIALVTPAEDVAIKDRPLAGAIVRHEVSDYGKWKAAFDAHGASRAQAGIVGHAVNRSVKNPNVIVAYLQADSLDALRAFASSPELKQAMQSAGVVGAPDVTFVQGGEWAS